MRSFVERAGVVADGMEQVRLSQPRSAIDEQRVVGASRLFGDRDGRRVCETVAGADDEGVEDVLVVEPAVAQAGVGRPRSRTHGGLVAHRLGPVVLGGDAGSIVGVGGVCHLISHVVVDGRGQGRVDGDGEPDVLSDGVGEGSNDDRPESGLQDVFGEVIRGGNQGGVPNEPEGLGEGDEGTLLGGQLLLGEARQGGVPVRGEVVFLCHGAHFPQLPATCPHGYPQVWM